jgi:hypothetical protein
MAEQHPQTVFVAENPRVAEAVIRLLAGIGVSAEIVEPPPATESQPITGITDMVTPDSFEVRVTDSDKVAAARELLDSAAAAVAVAAVREKRATRTGTVTAVCEDCGKSSEWPATAMGTTENCPHCGAYMDVPDPDDDWGGIDFGTEDEGDEK